MQMHAQYTGTTKQFCAEQKMPVQTFYSRRHTMGLSEPAQSKKSIMTNSPAAQSGQFAVAASVALAVILGVQHLNQPAPSEPFTTAPTAGPQGGLAPVSLEQTRTLPRNDMNEVLAKKRKINALIADHEQQVKLKQVQIDEEEKVSEEPDRP